MATPIAPDSGTLFQEELRLQPFWMLVACILINRTHWNQVKPVLAALQKRCKDARGMVHCPYDELIDIIRPLGLFNRRTAALRRFALAWTDGRPKNSEDVGDMPGCGLYAMQSWTIFVEGKKIPVSEVVDSKLAWYVQEKMR